MTAVVEEKAEAKQAVPIILHLAMDTLGFETRAFRMRSGCEKTGSQQITYLRSLV